MSISIRWKPKEDGTYVGSTELTRALQKYYGSLTFAEEMGAKDIPLLMALDSADIKGAGELARAIQDYNYIIVSTAS